ncbi:MAG: bifunctional folylpolyglutamate synthase/dihydrofolate synthase [Anaerolineae bacterium]|nr:bifunctional folylpolyglutamate synthase/dihydrofolate synthase [Anaerolineae bacterium]
MKYTAINSYPKALAYIYGHINFERKMMPKYSSDLLNLDRMQTLLARLDNPHRRFPSLLIAGTKGKGSTAAIAENILRAAGYRTGLFISPHLHSFRERIRVSGEMVSETHLTNLVNRLRPHFEAIPNLTVFEMVTALAFVTFAETNVDVAVLEVGLGGRLDATNVIDPLAAVITSISYDHVQLLGDTLTLIAREKAGIIRPGAMVVSAPQVPEAMTIIEEVCEQHGTNLTVVGDAPAWRWLPGRVTLKGQSFYLKDQAYWLPLLGAHQVTNAVTAMAAVTALSQRAGLRVDQLAMRQGLGAVEWPGRLEILGRDPYVIIDSAMNGDSAENLRRALTEYLPGREVTFIIGATADHEYTALLKILLPLARQVFITQSRHPRAAAPSVLAGVAASLGYQTTIEAPVERALAAALEAAHSRDVVCVTGSLFCVAQAREAWLRRHNLPLPPIDPVVGDLKKGWEPQKT